MAFRYEELCDCGEAMFSCYMQIRVALVLPVGVAQVLWIVADDALDEGEIIEQDGAAQTPRNVNPGIISYELLARDADCIASLWMLA